MGLIPFILDNISDNRVRQLKQQQQQLNDYMKQMGHNTTPQADAIAKIRQSIQRMQNGQKQNYKVD